MLAFLMSAKVGAANFIADPWEWVPPGTILPSDDWLRRRYEEFRSRLHWLFLWYDQVQFLDTFVLFNKQIEAWERESHRTKCGTEAFEKLAGEEKALRIVLRTDPAGNVFNSLEAVDQRQVRGNKNFIWYPDGPPNPGFARRLDGYKGLISDQPYRMSDHKKEMSKAFSAVLSTEPEANSDLAREYPALRELNQETLEQLMNLIGDDWRRSNIYTILGFGVSVRERRLQPRQPLIKLPLKIRESLRRFANDCYYRAVNHDLRVKSRFPGDRPPSAFELFFPVSGTGSIYPQDEASWSLRTELYTREAGPACLTGDVSMLFNRFRALELDQIRKLRHSGPFPDYRARYRDYEVADKLSSKSNEIRADIASLRASCLEELGKACSVPITRASYGNSCLAWRIAHVSASVVAAGLVHVGLGKAELHGLPWWAKSIAEASIDTPVLAGIGKTMTWLTVNYYRLQEGRPNAAPTRFLVDGAVKTSDVA